jgi:hypothetical protein
MSDSISHLDELTVGQPSKEAAANAVWNAMSPNALFGRRSSTTSALTWGYYGGKYRRADGTIDTKANATIALTDAATNYLLETDGVVSKVTAAPAGWPGPLAGGANALYQIVCAGGLVTGYTDYRTVARGATGAIGPAGPAGGGSGLTFTSDTGSTADSDPGAGLFKWNHATQSSASAIYVDNETAAAVSVTTFFASLPPDGYIHLVQEDDTTKWQLWKWSGLPTAGSGYYKFTGLTLMASGGSLADAKSTSISFKGTTPSTQPILLNFFYPGVPTASALLGIFAAPASITTITFAAAISGSAGKALTAATAQTDIDVRKNATTSSNGTSVGTVRFAAAGTVPTFIAASGFTLTGGTDYLTLWAPASPDATLANIGIDLAGTR